MIPPAFVDFYGDQTRWFVGEVINVKDDPLKLGRAQVRVFGVYDDIDPADLPWAQIVVPVTQGAHEGNGQYLGMLVGTQVFGIFLDGQNSQLPLVVGTIPKDGDQNPRVDQRGEYPKNKVYKTESGHFKEYDDTEGSERIMEYHSGGTWTEIQPSDDKPASRVTYINGTDTLVINGDCTVSVQGKATVTASEEITASAPVIKVVGDQEVTVSAPKINLKGTVVNINS